LRMWLRDDLQNCRLLLGEKNNFGNISKI
jgi:hypothetical protein